MKKLNLTFTVNIGYNAEKLYSTIHKHYFKPVLAYVYSYLQSLEFAEEATQNTFVNIFTKERLERLLQMAAQQKENGKTGLDHFVFHVAKNCIIDFTRSQDYLSHKSKVDLEAEHGRSIEISSDHPFSDEMEAALKTLPPLWEQILRLYVLEDYSHEEIAEALSISEGHSKNCLSKAKAALRVVLRRHQHM